MARQNRTNFLKPFFPLVLFLQVAPVLAQEEAATQELANPILLERKFQDAYEIILERSLDPISSSTLMMKGFQSMRKSPSLEGVAYSDLVSPTQRLGNRSDDLAAFRSALRATRAKAQGPVDLEELVSALIHGMVEALRDEGDHYCAYLEPDRNRELQEILKGELKSYAGIGISFEYRDNRCHVISPIPDSPAYRAGIRPGDAIVQVNGEELMSQDDATERISGDPGSRVILTVERKDVTEVLTYELIREMIVQPQLDKIMLPGNIGYVRINSFNEHTGKALLENLRYLEGLGMEKCLLDLRRNAGGLLTSAEEVSEVFLPKGSLIVGTQGRGDEKPVRRVTRWNFPFTRIPLILLVDENTASAAEIVTGAIRDNRRGVAVGKTTFGKGTVQEVKQLADNSAIKLTVARYLTPSGAMIDRKGIDPDYAVETETVVFPTKYSDPSTIDLAELAQDKQLRKAMEIFGYTFPIFPAVAAGG
jgi:carboxyl-terminal processing protease